MAMNASNLTNSVQRSSSHIKSSELSASMLFSDGEISGLTAVTVFLALTGSTGNSLMIFSILTQQTFAENPTNVLLLSQGFADLGFNLIVGLLYTYNLYNWIFPYYLLVTKVFGVASLLSILALTINRLISIYYPMEYPRIVTSKRAKSVVVLLWGVCVGDGVLNLIGLHTKTSELKMNARLLMVLSLLSFVVCYILIYKVSLRHRNAIRNQAHFVTGQQAGREADLKSSCSLLFLIGTFMVSWLPLTILSLVVNRFQGDSKENHRLAVIFLELVFLSSTTNPFVYYLRSDNFRQFVQRFHRVYIAPRLEFPVSNNQIRFSQKKRRIYFTSRVSPAHGHAFEKNDGRDKNLEHENNEERTGAFVIDVPRPYEETAS